MVGNRLNKQGFTLVETMFIIIVFIVILLALLQLYNNYYTIYNSQQAIVRGAGSASAAANELQNTILQADRIIASYNFSGVVYTTGQNTLILEVPSVDSSESVISGKHDYIVFYINGSKLYKLVQADPSSSRISLRKQLSDTVSTLTFTYNSTNLDQASEVSVDIQMQAVAGHVSLPYHLYQQIYLRNF